MKDLMSYKPAATLVSVEPIRDICIVKGVSYHSEIQLANGKAEEGATIAWYLVAQGEAAISTESKIELGDEIILRIAPSDKITVEENNKTFKQTVERIRAEVDESRRKVANGEKVDIIKLDNMKVEIVEYCFINSYDIYARKPKTK